MTTKRTHTLPMDSQARKDVPLWRGVMRYFPAALAACARVSDFGNKKHNPGEEMHHARGKSTDHADCIQRHLMDLEEDFGHGVGYDDHGMPQVGYLVWRSCALAQEWLEQNEGAPLAPGAKLPETPAVSPFNGDAIRAAVKKAEDAALDAFYEEPCRTALELEQKAAELEKQAKDLRKLAAVARSV